MKRNVCFGMIALLVSTSLWAEQWGDFEYKVEGSGAGRTVTITMYKGAGGAVEIPAAIEGLPVTVIGDQAFARCERLISVIVPDTVTIFEDGAFYMCLNLSTITFPGSLTFIGGGAFQFCESLTSLTIPDSVTEIGNWAFYGCTRLSSITIPRKLSIIGKGVFEDCTSLTKEIRAAIHARFGDEAF